MLRDHAFLTYKKYYVILNILRIADFFVSSGIHPHWCTAIKNNARKRQCLRVK